MATKAKAKAAKRHAPPKPSEPDMDPKDVKSSRLPSPYGERGPKLPTENDNSQNDPKQAHKFRAT